MPHVTIVEVGPRDGLQNEAAWVPTDAKIDWINALSKTGLQRIEVTSFVSKHAIPQLVDATTVYQSIEKPPEIRFSALVPNVRGMQQAIIANVQEIAVFTAASETFNQRNIRCSIAESLARCQLVVSEAKALNMKVRAYISCAIACPYEGAILPAKVAEVMEQLLKLGVDEISFGDTIGVSTPRQTVALLQAVQPALTEKTLAMHFHDTYGQAMANICAALELGVRCFDASTAGLGGCPYARGASGNVATEDVLYLMHGLGLETGIDIYKIVQAGDMMCQQLQRKNQSKVALALLANLSARNV
jgi:hydroxymethylglutaryl-CoA lyase